MQDHWVLNFGLCATREDQLIPYTGASELLAALQSAYQDRGITIAGKIEPFPAGEN